MIIATAQLNLTKPELRFCGGSNPAHGVSEIRNGEDLWQWSRLEIRLNAFRRSTISQNNLSSSSSSSSSSWNSFNRISKWMVFLAFYLKNKTTLIRAQSRSAVRPLSKIWNGAICKNSEQLKVVHYLRKKLHLRCFTGF